jgi:hypothetical protein
VAWQLRGCGVLRARRESPLVLAKERIELGGEVVSVGGQRGRREFYLYATKKVGGDIPLESLFAPLCH